MTQKSISASHGLADVKYEIRGDLARRAQELERRGYEIISLNIGNPGHLIAPGSSFNTPYSNHFRITTLPDPDVMHDIFSRIDSLLAQHA